MFCRVPRIRSFYQGSLNSRSAVGRPNATYPNAETPSLDRADSLQDNGFIDTNPVIRLQFLRASPLGVTKHANSELFEDRKKYESIYDIILPKK